MKVTFLNLPINLFFIKFLTIFYNFFFHIYKKSHQINIVKKEKEYKKSLWKIFKFFCRKKGKKQQHECELYKNVSEDENKNLLSMEKNMIEWEKTPFYN